MGEQNPFEDDPDIFADLVAFDGFPTLNHGDSLDSLVDAAGASPEDRSSNPFSTTPPVDQGRNQPAAVTEAPTLAINDSESTPAPESIQGDDGGQPARGKKRRRSRNSPEPDYSQMILELNKKRKRTGQACDRCRVRRYKCDPSPNGCLNCCMTGVSCKVTDCVTGETYVRGAAGRMAAEIEALKARVAGLERENEQLRREAKPQYGLQDRTSPATSGYSLVAFVSLQQHTHMQHQQIVALQQENLRIRQCDRMLREERQKLQKRIEEQEEMLRITEDVPLFNKKGNWDL